MTEYTDISQIYKALINTGYAIEHEDRQWNTRHSAPQKLAWKESFKEYQWEPPVEIDPRPWFDVHNQGNVGSCQGQALADACEGAHLITYGEEIQLSRGFAFMASQEFDNLLGQDTGSTLGGGTKAATRGLPLESVFDYTASYRTLLSQYRNSKDQILSDAGKLYKFPGAVDITSEEESFRWLSSWSGFIQIGIMWGVPDTWEITQYNGSAGGGHSVLIPGYLKRSGWPNDRGYLLKNSWGEQWGQNGWGLIHPKVVTQMINSRWSEWIGRSGAVAPKPQVHRMDYALANNFEVKLRKA